ncbi:hypothetical protein KC363_g6928 [Hortaea werneckii]|uniref:Uncharacterized protein n=1 Tax=Hortaea werneckii TaxID=91943 RepID=A0A3M7FTJ6_HORWE|nr:hypothetical protein KC325_g3164 [Hortaea werneckii]KAI6995532.1 hypothetical protein KC359_g3981 [Hortaea werneckii]KAI7147295.1 hypothetical protein KC344_g2881 [Hortaea werneckii]KAI7172731.1 hypothetical protein KC360_g5312 [Hortaea werneckii]KAI7185774.1 hypothetical protein KC363_g6928 [Hortaea werneckii]
MSKTELTPGEKKLLSLVWQCFESAPKARMITGDYRIITDRFLQVNMKKLATIGEYKTAASANTCWYNLKKKLFDTPNPTTTSSPSSSSSTASPATKPSTVNLTPSDLKLLNLIWQCLDGDTPKVDNKKLAQLGGYKTAASANTCWYNLRKKLFASQDGSAAAGGTTAGTASSPSPAGKVRSTPTKKKGKSDGIGISSPAGKAEAGGAKTPGSGRKKRAVDCDDDAAASAMDETPSKKLKGQEALIEEGSEALSTIAAAGSDADVKDAEGPVHRSDYIVPKLEPSDDMEDVVADEKGLGSKESSEGKVKMEEEDPQIMPSEYADSVTSTTAVAATDGEEQADEDGAMRFFQQMREYAE